MAVRVSTKAVAARKPIPQPGKKVGRLGRQHKLEAVRPPKYLTADEAALKLDVSEATIRFRMRAVKFRGTVQKGRYRFISPDLFADWKEIESRRRALAKDLGMIADGRFGASKTLEFRTSAGRVAAEVFARFMHGDSPADIVVKLARPPSEVMRLWDEFATMKQGITVDARQLLALATIIGYDPDVPSGQGLMEETRKKVNSLLGKIGSLERENQELKAKLEAGKEPAKEGKK